MNTSKKSSFDFPITQEDRPDTLLNDQMDHRRLDILGRRVTLITILIPILIILIGLLGYREIRGMISLSQDLGAKELTSMARNLESSLSNLSINHAKLESDIFARFDKLETTVNKFQENLQKMEASLDAVKTLKADKQAVSDEINKVDTKFQPVLNDLKSENAKVAADVASLNKKLAADVTDLNKKLAAEMEKISEQFNGITTAVAECQADLGLVSGEKADKKQLDITFKNQEKRIQDIADKMVHTMGEQIESMQVRIKELEKAKAVPEKPAPAQPAPKKAPAQP
ncbi:MAG: hypothetical protein AB7S77_11560 [Desulfatirhabdiaceae bacterium]